MSYPNFISDVKTAFKELIIKHGLEINAKSDGGPFAIVTLSNSKIVLEVICDFGYLEVYISGRNDLENQYNVFIVLNELNKGNDNFQKIKSNMAHNLKGLKHYVEQMQYSIPDVFIGNFKWMKNYENYREEYYQNIKTQNHEPNPINRRLQSRP